MLLYIKLIGTDHHLWYGSEFNNIHSITMLNSSWKYYAINGQISTYEEVN